MKYISTYMSLIQIQRVCFSSHETSLFETWAIATIWAIPLLAPEVQIDEITRWETVPAPYFWSFFPGCHIYHQFWKKMTMQVFKVEPWILINISGCVPRWWPTIQLVQYLNFCATFPLSPEVIHIVWSLGVMLVIKRIEEYMDRQTDILHS